MKRVVTWLLYTVPPCDPYRRTSTREHPLRARPEVSVAQPPLRDTADRGSARATARSTKGSARRRRAGPPARLPLPREVVSAFSGGSDTAPCAYTFECPAAAAIWRNCDTDPRPGGPRSRRARRRGSARASRLRSIAPNERGVRGSPTRSYSGVANVSGLTRVGLRDNLSALRR